MSDIDTQFNTAVSAVKGLDEQPDNDTLLRLYGLYKQATLGDVSGEKPGMFDFVGLAKYEAWKKLQGTPVEDAKRRYIELVRELGGELD